MCSVHVFTDSLVLGQGCTELGLDNISNIMYGVHTTLCGYVFGMGCMKIKSTCGYVLVSVCITGNVRIMYWVEGICF